jgi:hypothetical protein
MVDTQHFCLRWNNYQSSITSAFENLRDDEDFVDVTLACDGKSLKAHRVVLSACSPYFRELLKVRTPRPLAPLARSATNFPGPMRDAGRSTKHRGSARRGGDDLVGALEIALADPALVPRPRKQSVYNRWRFVGGPNESVT